MMGSLLEITMTKSKALENIDFLQKFVDQVRKNASKRGINEEGIDSYTLGYVVSMLGATLTPKMKKEITERIEYFGKLEVLIDKSK